MNGQENQTFISDGDNSASVEERNERLAATLNTAPNRYREIVRIERDADGGGWVITYHS